MKGKAQNQPKEKVKEEAKKKQLGLIQEPKEVRNQINVVLVMARKERVLIENRSVHRSVGSGLCLTRTRPD